MKTTIRTVLAVAAGLALAFALVVAVEALSAVVHPVPPGTETMEQMCEHVARYPDWVLAVVVLAWGAATFASVWVAARIGNPAAGIAVALVLTLAIVWNIAMLPYALWFKVVMLGCFAAACCWGVTRGVRRSPPVVDVT
jgi:hypothetical protein